MNENFYSSKKWRNLITVLKLERAKDGIVYCEHCGKPIEHNYDIIAHHIIQLTATNVKDANIALNPDNIMLVHHRCHNLIHGRIGYVKPVVYIVYGAPCSGKSTYVQSQLHEGDLLIDVDRIWWAVSGLDMYAKPGRLTTNVMGIYNKLLDDVRVRNGQWQCCYIVGGFKNKIQRERLADKLGAKLILIDTPKAECLYRLEHCRDGRSKANWRKYIDEWFAFNSLTPPGLEALGVEKGGEGVTS